METLHKVGFFIYIYVVFIIYKHWCMKFLRKHISLLNEAIDRCSGATIAAGTNFELQDGPSGKVETFVITDDRNNSFEYSGKKYNTDAVTVINSDNHFCV